MSDKAIWVFVHLAMLAGMGMAIWGLDLVAFLICFVAFCQMPSYEPTVTTSAPLKDQP